jgi:regulator of ribosome biosynthesis
MAEERQLDLGNLTCFDVNDTSFLEGGSLEESISARAAENAQHMMQKVFDLPRDGPEAGINGIVVILPKASTPVPREKPLPKATALTTWEKFARTKGINKKKKSRMVFDETKQEYRPAWGYKRANDEAENWITPAKPGEDLTVDPWTRMENEKAERVAKNKGKQRKNIQGALKGVEGKNRAPGAIDLSSAKSATNSHAVGKKAARARPDSHVDVALGLAQKATASMGAFDSLRKFEKAPKKQKEAHKNEAEYDMGKERKSALAVLDRIMGVGASEVSGEEKAARVVHKQLMQEGVRTGDKKGRGKRKKPGADGIADPWVLDTSSVNNRSSSKKAQKKKGAYGGKHGQGKGQKGSSQKHKTSKPKARK